MTLDTAPSRPAEPGDDARRSRRKKKPPTARRPRCPTGRSGPPRATRPRRWPRCPRPRRVGRPSARAEEGPRPEGQDEARRRRETPAATPGSLRAIGNAWIDVAPGRGPLGLARVSSYTNDLEVAYEFLGGDTAAAEITEKQIAAFNVSKGVMKKRNGKPKAQPTILKTRRALRLALVWAEQKGLIKKAPFAAKTPA